MSQGSVQLHHSIVPGSLHHTKCLIGSLMQACPGAAGRVAMPDLTTRTSPMSSQAAVHSIDELKNLRVALALYGEDTLGTLGAVEAEVRRTLRWVEEERPVYWQEQIKRRREQVAMARSDVFRRNLQKRPDYNPAMSEQKEALRKAEASLQDAEKRLVLVRKWQPRLRTRRPRISRERSAPERHGCRRRPRRRQFADPDHRRSGGVSSGCAAVRIGFGRRIDVCHGHRTGPIRFDRDHGHGPKRRPLKKPKPRRELTPRPRHVPEAEAPVAIDATLPTNNDAATDDPPTHSL